MQTFIWLAHAAADLAVAGRSPKLDLINLDSLQPNGSRPSVKTQHDSALRGTGPEQWLARES